MRARILMALFILSLPLGLGCGSAAGLGGGANTTVTITNKITNLAAGQSYAFNIDVQHDQGTGFTLNLSGQGTLVNTGTTATYIAPSAPPSPNSITVTATAANGSGASDSDTFSITAAAGPVVSISPATFSVVAGGSLVTLSISVTNDAPNDTLMGGVSGSPACNGPCGSLGSISGVAGSGAYTADYTPPAAVTSSTQQQVSVLSNLPSASIGTAFVTINP